MSNEKVFLLRASVQQYAWGKPGLQSEVAKLCQSGDKQFKLGESSPYAELWMGTHPKGPSVIESSGKSLSAWIEEHPDCVGDMVRKLFPKVGQLPFLFKVLSVNIALSIQVHPNKIDAVRLHKDNPSEYPDDNHKPEMAIALTPFKALCGFRPTREIVAFLQNVPELHRLIGDKHLDELSTSSDAPSALSRCFAALITSSDKKVKSELLTLVSRVKQEKSSGKDISSSLGEVILRLHDQFPGDVGCFCIYFMNYIELDVGQAIFLGANLPHAYLDGDCIECMACSDNVVRAGLTPKFKDVNTLLKMLNYTSMTIQETLFSCATNSTDPYLRIYDPPVPDFSVNKIQLPVGVDKYVIAAVDGASIVLVISGVAQAVVGGGESTIHLRRGSVLFLSAKEAVQLSVTSHASQEMLMFRAYCVLS